MICPGLNDGAALEKTIADLGAMYPACQSLALVPVGLTDHRDGLEGLRRFTRDEARAVLDSAEKWQKKFMKRYGTPFLLPADEFYLAAGRAVPPDGFYEDYAQIENGIGMMRLLETELEQAYAEADLSKARPARLVIATGVSAAPFLKGLVRRFDIPGVEVKVIAVENEFFGHSVTVAGLLTGSDLVRALRGETADRVLITECMLRDSEDVFLDDMTLDQVEREVGIPFVKVGRRGDELLGALMNG